MNFYKGGNCSNLQRKIAYLNNEIIEFEDVKEFCLNHKYFVYLTHNSNLYIPVYVNSSEIYFDCMLIQSGNIKVKRIAITYLNTVTLNEYVAEKTSNKVTVIDENSTDAQYPSAKSVYDELQKKSNSSDLADVATSGSYSDLFDKPTIDNVVTEESENAVKSSGIYDYVNSSVSTNTAYFRGTFNSVAELNAYTGDKTLNDYAFVKITDSAGNTLYNRYKWNNTSWVFEYSLNNSSFTANQWSTINSGLTSDDKTEIAKISNIETQIADMQDEIGNKFGAENFNSEQFTVKNNVVSLTGGGGGGGSSSLYIYMTQAEYEALTEYEQDQMYWVIYPNFDYVIWQNGKVINSALFNHGINANSDTSWLSLDYTSETSYKRIVQPNLALVGLFSGVSGNSSNISSINAENVYIGRNIKSIKNYAFRASHVVSISIPDSVTSIEDKVFMNAVYLIKITINKPQGSISGSPWGATNATVIWND